MPDDPPFTDVFGIWYWTSNTAAIARDHDWYVDLAGGRMIFGGKDQSLTGFTVLLTSPSNSKRVYSNA